MTVGGQGAVAGTGRRATDDWRWAVAFFVVTYALTALLWWPILRAGAPLSALSGRLVLPFLLAGVAPSLVALALAGVEGGRSGIGRLLGQAGRWRFGPGWYALALLLAPLIALVALALSALLGGPAPAVRLDYLVPVAAVGEELGWRGYALPRLQGRIGPLPASLVIGVVWAAWHLPYFADPAVHPLPFALGFPLFAAVLVAESVLATWLYNSTGGSVLATMLFHESIHVASVVPVVPGVLAALVTALVNAAAAASGGALAGVARMWPLGTAAQPRSP